MFVYFQSPTCLQGLQRRTTYHHGQNLYRREDIGEYRDPNCTEVAQLFQ